MKLKSKTAFYDRTKTNVDSRTMQKEISNIITVLALPVFVIAFSIVSIRYFLTLRTYNTKVIEVSQEAKDTAETNLASVESLKGSLSDLESGDFGSKEVLDALPSKYDYLALATSIEKIVLQTGLTMEGFTAEDLTGSIGEFAPEPTPEQMKFTLSAQGSYERIQNLVSNFEKSIRPMQIQSMKLAGDGDSMQVDLSILTYYQLSESLEITTETVTPDA